MTDPNSELEAYCNYCGGPRSNLTGWHGCAPSQRAKRRLTAALCGIYELMAGGKELKETDHDIRRAYRTQKIKAE